jgi:hypothetical protein
MPGIPFKVAAKHLTDGERHALLLTDDGSRCLLRFGYLRRGTGDVFLPETMLDDWGHEIGGVALYHWVGENATHFPRAELFGFDRAGRPQQCFVRELDLTASYICLAYSDASTTLTEGVRIDAVLLPATGTSRRRLERAPDNISFPLRKAEVKWWLVEPTAVGTAGDGLYRLLEADESG